MLKNSPEHTTRGQKLFLLGASHNPFPLDSYNQPARYRSRITSVTLKKSHEIWYTSWYPILWRHWWDKLDSSWCVFQNQCQCYCETYGFLQVCKLSLWLLHCTYHGSPYVYNIYICVCVYVCMYCAKRKWLMRKITIASLYLYSITSVL